MNHCGRRKMSECGSIFPERKQTNLGRIVACSMDCVAAQIDESVEFQRV